MRNATIERVELELPMLALVLIGVAWSHYDPKAEIRGYGDGLLGHGVTIAGTHYGCTSETIINSSGERVDCVRLSVRGRMFDGTPDPFREFLIPFEECRKITLQIGVGVID